MSDSASTGTVAEPVLTTEEVFKLAIICAKNNWPLLVVSAPGMGKTSIMHQVADALQCNIQVSHPVVDSPIDYKGQPYAWMENGGKLKSQPKAAFIPYGDLENLINAQSLLIHLADDLGQATDVVKSAYMQLLLARKINGHAVSPHVVFFACTNGKEHNANVTRFLEPLKDRFHTIVRMKTEEPHWRKWALAHAVAHEVVSWVRMNPQFLESFQPTQDFSRTPTPRSIEQLSDLYLAGVDKGMQLRTFAGTVGTEAAVSYMAHLDYYSKIQDPDIVIASPEKADIPDEPALLYVLCGALAAKSNKRNIVPIMKFAQRLGKLDECREFSMMLIKDAIMRSPAETMGNVEFCKWATEHQEELGL